MWNFTKSAEGETYVNEKKSATCLNSILRKNLIPGLMSVGIIVWEKGLKGHDVIVAGQTDVQAYERQKRWADGKMNSYMASC